MPELRDKIEIFIISQFLYEFLFILHALSVSPLFVELSVRCWPRSSVTILIVDTFSWCVLTILSILETLLNFLCHGSRVVEDYVCKLRVYARVYAYIYREVGGGVDSSAIGIKSPSDTPFYVPSQSVPCLSGLVWKRVCFSVWFSTGYFIYKDSLFFRIDIGKRVLSLSEMVM